MKTDRRSRRGIKSEILSLRQAGMSYGNIAKELNCSKGTIPYHCKNEELNGERCKRHNKTPLSTQTAIKAYMQRPEVNVAKATRAFQVSRMTILKYGRAEG